jgi:hypothetical protein
MEGSGFDPVLLWVSRTIRMEALELLYHSATVKFGYCLQKTAMQRMSSLFSRKLKPGLPLDHFAYMCRIALTENIDKDHRNRRIFEKSAVETRSEASYRPSTSPRKVAHNSYC